MPAWESLPGDPAVAVSVRWLPPVPRSPAREFPSWFLEPGSGNKTVLVLFLEVCLVTPEDSSEDQGAHNQEEAAQAFETEPEGKFPLPPGKESDEQD